MYPYRVVAVDLRGYNLSERPEGLENYKLPEIVEDLRALIEHFSKYYSIGDVKNMQMSMTCVFMLVFLLFRFVVKH